ncbi:MAG: tetraacyldisaccharide 4'-kinase [Candidatus Zixiibacteriota bacterium]
MWERVWKKILRRRRFSILELPAAGLWVGSLGYRVASRLHRAARKPSARVTLPVISIGNITVGGSGKTPLVEFLSRFLLSDGLRVGIVSSGYRRFDPASFVEKGYKVQNRSFRETGDEVQFLSRQLPEAVFSLDKSKSAAAQHLAESGMVDVIVVDDGFQHFELARDLDIITYDAAIPARMLKPFPYGLLREPLSALRRADIVVITRSNFARDIGGLIQKLHRINPDATHFHAQFLTEELVGQDRRLPVKYLEDKAVFLFAGVGNFRVLRKQAAALCADLDYAMELSDHQHYDLRLLDKIKRLADDYESDVILTTGKDWVKLGDFDFGREIYYLAQSIDLDPGEEKLIGLVKERLRL